MRSRATTVALIASFVVAGCGGGGDSADSDPPAAPAAPAAPAPSAPAADVGVIRDWSDSLRAGRLDDASALFAVPATAENGTGQLLLDSRMQVRGFNESLPCGAKLLSTLRRGPYTVATFRLTERPGGDCGTGGGGKAATAFRIEDGKIVEWLRVQVPPAQPPEPRPKPKPPPDPAV